MAEIFTTEWESIKDYDDRMKTIPHYRKHPEMLPFIGRNYKEAKMFLIGESHFFEALTEAEIEYAEKGWYDAPLPEGFNLAYRGNYDTRGVINRFLTRKRTKAHSMFRNPAKGIISALKLDDVSDSEAFTACGFMNYFQRPALKAHESIETSEDDAKVAYQTFKQVIEIIEPCVIIFLSKKAFESYDASRKGSSDEEDKRVVHTSHPTCWNFDNGLARFEDIIVNSPVCFRGFDSYSKLPLSALPEMPNQIKILQKGQNRFIENEGTVRFYVDPFTDIVSEIVWHVQLDGVKYGLGYNVKLKFLWFWNYTEKEYMKENCWKSDQRRNSLFETAVQYIKEI